MSFSWNTFWDAESVIDEHGWSTELGIPFSSLRFQVVEDKTIMGLTVVNFRPAISEWISFPAISPDIANSLWKPSLASRIEFTGLKPEKPVYVTPYITAGIGQINKLDAAGMEYKMASKFKYDAGLDLGLTYYFDYVNFASRNMRFTNHIPGVRGLLTVTTKTSLSAFMQYNTAVNKVVTNVRFRYNPREGNDFYIVYDEGLNTRLTREIPSLPFSSGRTLLLKYTYTFRF